jgi:hypothetical protein
LANSPTFKTGAWKNSIVLSAETPSCRIICVTGHARELQMHVESVRGDILRASESAWHGVRNALGSLKPRVSELELFDHDSGRRLMVGATGLRAEFQRREVIVPVLVAAAVVAYVVVGALTFASGDLPRLIGAGIAGFIPGAVALALLTVDVRKGKLRWN